MRIRIGEHMREVPVDEGADRETRAAFFETAASEHMVRIVIAANWVRVRERWVYLFNSVRAERITGVSNYADGAALLTDAEDNEAFEPRTVEEIAETIAQIGEE